jgi:CheY-like chemotaxis protein
MPPERRFPPRSVLVVDHDKDSATSLAGPLRYMGNDVEIAHDGPSALEVERTFRPDIVLIDLALPGMDAFTVARFLRAEPQRNVSLVSVAGLTKPKVLIRAKEAGFTYHLRKPADLGAFQSMFVALGVAEETAADAARKWVATYTRGIISVDEFVLLVLESGARHDPAEMAELIPDELLDAVRKSAESPPTDVSSVLPGYTNSLLSAEQIESRREDIFKGAWRWFRYFRA